MPEFKFYCPQCGQHIQCDTGHLGRQINCPVCQQAIVVPQVPAAVPIPPQPAPVFSPDQSTAPAAGRTHPVTPVAQPAATVQSRTLQNILMIVVAAVMLAGLCVGGWLGYSKFKLYGLREHLPPGLVGMWSGEGDGKNWAEGNSASLTGVSVKSGEMVRVFSFDETNSGIKIPATPSLDVGQGQGFTIMAWIKPSSLSRRNEILEWDNGEPGQIVTWGVHMQLLEPQEFGLGAGNLFADVHGTDGQVHWLMARGGTITANIFQHVALSYDKTAGIARLFCNGNIVVEQHIGQFTPQTSYDFYIGRRPAGDGVHSFSGLIAKAGVFNRALSAEEILKLYNEQK